MWHKQQQQQQQQQRSQRASRASLGQVLPASASRYSTATWSGRHLQPHKRPSLQVDAFQPTVGQHRFHCSPNQDTWIKDVASGPIATENSRN